LRHCIQSGDYEDKLAAQPGKQKHLSIAVAPLPLVR
jgi:hypothetical protein